MSRSYDRRTVWTPAKRPDWLAIFNDLGRHLDIKSIVPLDENSLLNAAAQNTGLDDFALADHRAGLWDNVIDWMESGVLPKTACAHMQYRDFMKAPMRAIESIYRDLGLPIAKEALALMEAHLAGKPQGGLGRHEYQRADDSVIAEERRKYKRYQDYFNVPNEV